MNNTIIKNGKICIKKFNFDIAYKIKILPSDIKTMEDLLQYIKFKIEQSIDWNAMNNRSMIGYGKSGYQSLKNLPKNKTNDII